MHVPKPFIVALGAASLVQAAIVGRAEPIGVEYSKPDCGGPNPTNNYKATYMTFLPSTRSVKLQQGHKYTAYPAVDQDGLCSGTSLGPVEGGTCKNFSRTGIRCIQVNYGA